MTHHRNFYFEKVSSRTTHGGVMPSGPHYGADAHADSNIIQLAALRHPGTVGLNSLVKEREFFIDGAELGSGLLFASVLLLPALLVFGVVFFYLALIS